MRLETLPKECQKTLVDYFSSPYNGCVYIYNNKISLADIENHNFSSLLSHERAEGGTSTAMNICRAVLSFMVDIGEKRVLDVGCKIGHFSFLMAEMGAYVVAVDNAELPIDVLRCLAQVRGMSDRIEAVSQPIEDYVKYERNKFDLVLMLNVLDHLSRQGGDVACKVLRKVSYTSNNMVVMTGPTDQIKTQDDVPKMVFESSSFIRSRKLLEHSYGDRTLWAFWK